MNCSAKKAPPPPASDFTPSLAGLLDNRARGCVGDFLQENISRQARLSVVSAYFTIYAFEALAPQLHGIKEMRFLFGEPHFVLDPDRNDRQAFQIGESGLSLRDQLRQKQVARECAEWIEQSVAIKSIRQSNLLHGKMYHIENEDRSVALLGSSNFTLSGLGRGSKPNIELNLALGDESERAELKKWFDELWKSDLVEPVKDKVLAYLKELYQPNAPEFLYYKTLFHLFQKFLDEQSQGGLLDERNQLIDTQIWQALFAFQKDGVKGAINKILRHNGCIIADSVGLGKTFEALAIIKYFELRNDKVLVLCPKKLRENWTAYLAQNNSELNPFVADRFGYTVLSHTDLSRSNGQSGDVNLATLNWGNFDLVVIDESHNFRNNTRGRRDEDNNVIRKTRYERMMDDIINKGARTKVLLLSATPVNNDLKDLRNQLYLITGDKDNAFAESIKITSLKDTLAAAQRTFSEWANDHDGPNAHDTRLLLEKLPSAFFSLLDEVTIARSRKHILRYYQNALQEVGHFPERAKPQAQFPSIDLASRFLSYDRINDEISGYKLALFSPSAYVQEAQRALYREETVRNFSQERREHFLIGMMKVNFLKRLESSVNSFAISMERTIAKIEAIEARLVAFQEYQQAQQEENEQNAAWKKPEAQLSFAEMKPPPSQLDFSDLQPENSGEGDEDAAQAWQIGVRGYNLAHLDVARWRRDLARDKKQLHLLFLSAKDITPDRDAKLHDLKEIIRAKAQNPTVNKNGVANRKVLVFTAFADTAHYLYRELCPWAQSELGLHSAVVSGGPGGSKTTFGQSDFNHILTNFSPVAKKRGAMKTMPQDGEIDLLIATDCISEGQNLQDCDYLVNYDIHWNPVRLIQRFGRIDRIGSLNPVVQLVNFWPTPDLNKYINLKNRVEARMALVDIAATSEDDMLNVGQIEELVQDELKYRDKQLLRLKDEVLDLEEFNENVALNEFTLDDFRVELLHYIQANRHALENAPLGLYAIVPPHPTNPKMGPGVIFCLRQKGETGQTQTVNPLQPHYLIYVRDDGEIRYGFTQPKPILEVFRALCAGQSAAYDELCRLFDKQTEGGQHMEGYNALLQKAVAAIAHAFQRRNESSLGAGRGAVLVGAAQQATPATDFDLISWLVIADFSE